MESAELRRLIVRHRHVAPMLSVLLAGTDARVTITDLDGGVILDRQAGDAPADAPDERHPIVVDGSPVGWVAGPRPAGAIAAVLSYACAREADKRALAREALDRYRELNLIYDLADEIGATLETDAIARVAVTRRAGCRPAARASSASEPRRTPGRAAARRSPGATVEPGVGILGAISVGDPRSSTTSPAIPGRAPRNGRSRRSSAAPLRVARRADRDDRHDLERAGRVPRLGPAAARRDRVAGGADLRPGCGPRGRAADRPPLASD